MIYNTPELLIDNDWYSVCIFPKIENNKESFRYVIVTDELGKTEFDNHNIKGVITSVKFPISLRKGMETTPLEEFFLTFEKRKDYYVTQTNPIPLEENKSLFLVTREDKSIGIIKYPRK